MTTSPWFQEYWIQWAAAPGRLTGDTRRQIAICDENRCASAEDLPSTGARGVFWVDDIEAIVFNRGDGWKRLDTLEAV